MKKILSIIMIIVSFTGLLLFAEPAAAISDSNHYFGSDDDGAYVLSYNGKRADIAVYPSGNSYYIDLGYDIAAGTAGFGKAVLLSNDVPNDMLIVLVYAPLTDYQCNFAVNGMKAFNNTVFCCDRNSVYISDDKETNILRRYSFEGNLLNTFSFDNRVAQVFCDHDGTVYAVSRSRLYRLGDSASSIGGDNVSVPLVPIGNGFAASPDGRIYDISGSTAEYMFSADSSNRAVGGCVSGGIVYYPNGTTISGYDIITGEKQCYFQMNSSPELLYFDGDNILALGGGNALYIRKEQFTKIEKPKDNNNTPSTVSKPDEELRYEIRSDVYNIDFSDYTISGISPDTTVAAFRKNMIYSGYELHLYKGSSEIRSGNVGTACTAVFSCDTESISFELSVRGDLTGEGRMNSRDLNILMDYTIGAVSFNGVYSISADLNGDNRIDAVDIALMKRY